MQNSSSEWWCLIPIVNIRYGSTLIGMNSASNRGVAPYCALGSVASTGAGSCTSGSAYPYGDGCATQHCAFERKVGPGDTMICGEVGSAEMEGLALASFSNILEHSRGRLIDPPEKRNTLKYQQK